MTMLNMASFWIPTFLQKQELNEVIGKLIQLNAHQKANLLCVLHYNENMFNGTLIIYPHKKVHIDIDPNPKPVHSLTHLVPHVSLYSSKMN